MKLYRACICAGHAPLKVNTAGARGRFGCTRKGRKGKKKGSEDFPDPDRYSVRRGHDS